MHEIPPRLHLPLTSNHPSQLILLPTETCCSKEKVYLVLLHQSLKNPHLHYLAFIVTGGLGAIGSAVARGLLAKKATAIIFDTPSEEKAATRLEALGFSDGVHYVQADVTDIEQLNAACENVLGIIPKGTLFGGVHCAGIAPGRKWSNKLSDSAAVSPSKTVSRTPLIPRIPSRQPL